jgi:hypothetical protein
MASVKRQKHFKNSSGISNFEYMVLSEANRYCDRSMWNDLNRELIAKLSPEEFAWYAEFLGHYVQGNKVDAKIIGEENAEILNSPEKYRERMRAKNHRYGCCPYHVRSRVGIFDKQGKEEILLVADVKRGEDE